MTVAHSNRRRPAERFAEEERGRHPEADVRVTGERGKWRVRRDRLTQDPEQVRVVVLYGL